MSSEPFCMASASVQPGYCTWPKLFLNLNGGMPASQESRVRMSLKTSLVVNQRLDRSKVGSNRRCKFSAISIGYNTPLHWPNDMEGITMSWPLLPLVLTPYPKITGVIWLCTRPLRADHRRRWRHYCRPAPNQVSGKPMLTGHYLSLRGLSPLD